MLDTILTPLIEPQKTEEPVAWELAKQLLVKSANSLTGVITSFMHDVINHEKSSESELMALGLYLNLYLDQKPEVKSQPGLEQLRLTATTTGIWPQGTSSQVYKPVLVQALGAAGQMYSPRITANCIPSQMI